MLFNSGSRKPFGSTSCQCCLMQLWNGTRMLAHLRCSRRRDPATQCHLPPAESSAIGQLRAQESPKTEQSERLTRLQDHLLYGPRRDWDHVWFSQVQTETCWLCSLFVVARLSAFCHLLRNLPRVVQVEKKTGFLRRPECRWFLNL